MVITREFCAENMTLVPAAVKAGANRIELCDNLAVGGTSPSFGVIRSAVEFACDAGVGVMAMCRPRGGNFVYNEAEQRMLIDDISCARSLGVTGVVFGCVRLTADGCFELDGELVRKLVETAKGNACGIAAGMPPTQVTFHMAFDVLDDARQHEAIDLLAGLGVERILTHGGAADTPIEHNFAHLSDLVSYAAGRVVILPGGGITWQNAEHVAAALGVREVHGTKVVRL